MEDNDNRRRLYDNLYKEFQLPEYNQFSEDMKDETKRKRLWENVGKEYQLPDFDKFSRDMGYEVQTTQQGNQNAQNAKKPQQTVQSSHVEEGRGLSSDNGYSKQKTAFDKATEQAWNKLAHEGGFKWTIEGHPEVKMVAVTDDLVKKFPQLEQSRGYQVPFNMSTGTPIMQNIDDKGNIITPDEASEQYTKILTNQDFDYVPKQETAAVQIGSVVNTALSTKGGWLDRAVQKAMEESYGKDWKNRKYVSDGKEISSSEIYAKAKQGIYDNINGVLGDIRKSLLFSTDEQRRRTVDELYQKGYLKEDFLPKANALHYISNIDKGEQVEELRQRKLKLQVQREMVMDKLNQIPQPDHAENMAEFYARRANDGSELYASDLRKIDKQIAQYDAVIDELEGRNNLKSEWGHAVQTSGITDIGAWDFGITDLKDAMMMYPLARKMQNGENITQDDFMSLKLLAQANDADAVENAVMPSSYNMFKGSLQSVPFTVQFGAGKTFAEGAASVVNKAATRAVKGAILKAGGKKALRAAEKVAEKAAESKILKFCGMLGKDFEKAFVMENTTGAATTGAEILNRHIGTVTESDDGFKMEGESLPTAIIKGEISQNIESQTEFLGEHFPSSLKFIRGMAHTKVGSAMGLRNLAAWLTKVSRTEFATTLKSYATKAGINGVLGEYLEEVAGTAENALLVGDQKFSDLFDVKQQEEVAGSVVLSCLGMGIFGTAIYTGQRGLNMPAYYRLQHIQNKWDNAGLDLFTGEEWAKLKDRIDNTPNEGMKFVMADILRGQNMTEEQMRAAYNYASCTLTLRGMNLGAMKAAQLGLTDDRHIEQDNAYVEGRQAKDEDKHDIQIEFEDRSHELAEKLGISEQQLDNMSDEELESLTGKDDQLDNLIYDYQTSHAKYQGVVDNADDEIDKAAQEAARQTDMATDKSRGTVRNATIKATKGEEDYGVYIVSGNVATNEDGSINVGESDDMILYYDPKTGKIEHCDALRFAALGEEVNAEETRNQAIADAKEKAIRKQAGIIDGTVGEGTTFTITDAQGVEHTYEVLAENGDGSAMITLDGNVQEAPVSLQDLQNLKDAEDAKNLEAAKMQRQQYEEEREKQNAPVEDNLDYADIINTDGKVEIADVVDEEGNPMFPDAEQVFFVQNQGNRAKVMVLDNEGNLKAKLVDKSAVQSLGTMSVDEYRQGRQEALKEAENESEPSLVGETETSNNVIPIDNVATDNTTTNETQPGNEAGLTTPNETQNEGDLNASNEQESTPKITLEDGTEVPMLEDGNPDFSQLTAGQVAELYDTQFGEDAGQIITNNVDRSKKALDKANAMKVSGGSFVEQKASKEAKDKAIAEAQAKYDSAKAIEDAYNERMLAKEEDTPEGRRNLIEKARRKFNRMKSSVKDNAQAIAQLYNETVGSLLHRLYDSTGIDVFDDTANTVDEYVASSIAPYSLNYEGTETSKGVKQETGLSRSDFAKTGFLAKEGKGKTIGQLANDLWRDRPSNLENITDQDVRNAIIDLITSGQTAFGLKNHIQNLRIAEAENVLEQQKRQADELAHAEKQKEEESQSTEMVDNNAEESSNTEATPADAQEEDKLADMPFEAPSPDEDSPFSAKDKAKDPLEVWNNMTDEEKAAYIENNRVKDTRLVDDVVGKKLRKAIEKIAEMMGATVQWQRTDMIRNGWFNPNTKTIYLALDSSVLWGVQFVFGHEVTHDIKTKSPAMYEELKGLVKEKYGEEKFEAMTNKNVKRYADVGKTGNDRSYYEEETVADAIGATIRDLNLTRSLALKMSHPLLAKMHDVLLKVKNALMATPYTDDVKGIIRTIEQVYVKTANGTFESSASEGTNDEQFGVRDANERFNNEIFKPEDMQIVEHEKFSVKGNNEEAKEFHGIIDEMFKDGFDKSKHLRERYNLGETPTWMKTIGIKGDNFSLSFKCIKIHKGKDADHDLTKEEWHELPDAIKKPFAVTRYQGANDRFRLYVNINHNGKPVAVGIDVKRVNQGKEKPQLDVNSVKTVFAHHGEIGGSEVLVAYDEKITPQQQALLRGLNFHEYPTIQELSAANIVNPSETSKGNAEKFSLRLQDAINETDTEPTEAQKKSGNYKKGHVKFGGYDYTIENPKGSYRSGVDENGKEWKQKMNDTYGYIRGKFGKDGDHLDMFINDKADLDSWNGDVYVVDQVKPDGKFDEHKVMYGYDSLEEAKKAYLSNYEKGWTGLGNITPVSKADFDKWLDKSNRKLKPFADYADITSKTNMDTAPSNFEEFLEHPAVRYSIRNEKERAAAEDAYNFAQENRPDRYSRYAIVNMEKPGAVPQYLEKKTVADNWRRYYNKLKWGNYKLFDLDKPFEDNVKNLVGKFPETFRQGNEEKYSLIGKKGAEALDHAEEVSTRLDNLNVARQMEGAKKDAKAIKMATGWERGADGKWRYEIADSKLNDMMDVDGKGKMVKRHKEDMLWTSGKLGEVVVAPELFKAYPKLKDVRLETDSIMNNLPSNGEYNAKTNTITIHADELKYLDSILNHEIQHAIQHIEGFARGGNPEYLQWRIEAAKKEWRARAWADALRDKAEEMGEHYNQVEVEKALIDEYKEMGMDNDEWMPDKETRIKGFNYFARGYADRSFDDDIRAFRLNESTRSYYNSYVEYTKLGGEVEARNVQSRMNMSPEERRKTLAEETEDVARKDQIFLYGDNDAYSLKQDKDAEYLEAVKNGDMEKAQKMVYDAARAAGYENGTDYQGEGSWNAPSASVEKEDFANLDALRESVEEYSGDTNVFGIINGVTTNDDDFYYNPGRVGFRDAAASETSSVLRRLRYDKADANTKVKVYRTVPADVKGNKLMSGDWIALSKQYCIEHGNGRYGEGGYRIIEEEVPIKTIWNDGNDMREFGFDDGNNNEAEKNVPNNRKLLDAVTYDNNGNVIPLSERFNESNDDIRYSLKDEKTLAGVHNITEEKLRKVLQLGGFANPSLAVIDTNKTGHDKFGEISFIAPSALVDKESGHTAGTWTTDAYTQRYPSVERQMSDKGYDKFCKWVDGLDFTDSEKAEIKRQAADALEDNREPAWELMYLKEKGIDIKAYSSDVDYGWESVAETYGSVDDVLKAMEGDAELDEKIRKLVKVKITSPLMNKIRNTVRHQIQEETGNVPSPVNPAVRKRVREIFDKEYAPKLFDENGQVKSEDVRKVVRKMLAKYNDTKRFNFQKAKAKASTYVHNNGMYTDYLRWQEDKLEDYGTKGRIFRGYKNDGTRKYVPETLENVSKAMREEADGQTNGSEYTSFGSFIAKLASRVDSTDEMRANKDKLSSNEDKEEFYEKWNDVYYDLAKFLYNDVFYGEQRLHDIVLQSDPKKYAKKEYGITLTPTFMKKLDALKNAVRTELKSAYFETKYNRPLRLNEFAAAVVPDNLGEDVRKGIENAGLPMYDYDPTKEGDRSRAFNEAINSSDNIRFSLKSMMEKPEGWKQANKKAIHIAEAIERDPKFSLKNLDGTLIKAGTYFSGGGLVEEGLKGIIDPVVAVEYDEKISGVYRNNFGNHIVTADVRDVDPKELVGKIDGEVEYFHASPVCKNYSLAKNNHEELELDKETAASTAEFISKVRPKVVTIENVKGYKDSEAMKTITDALDEAGYKWDADVYNAADYGGYTNRERLIVRAVRDGELPAKPEKQKRKSGWYEAVEDIIPTLTEKNGVAPWMDERLKADGIDWRHIDKPLYVMGSGYANGTVPHAFADELLPTLRTKSGDVIVMPDGKVYRAMGRVLARVSGVSDDYQMPASEALSHTIIGNGIPTQLTENVIAPLVRDVLHPEVEEKASLKDADRKQTQLDIILKTNPMLDDYHTGIRKVEDIKTLGESVEEAVAFYPNQIKSADNNNGDFSTENDDIRYSLRVDRYRYELNQWKKDNNLPKDAERPQLPVREPNESAADFLKRVKEYRKQAALWATAPTYEDHLLVSDTAQGQFNLEMQRKAVLTRIVIQDSMLAIRKAQEAIMKEKGVDKLNPAEDAYTAENRSHGKAKNEFEEYNDEFLQPLRKAYNELMQRLGKSYDNVKVYMIAKHGLERNAYIAFKYALDEDYETNEERMNAYNNYKADMDRLNNDADFEAGRIDFAAWKQRDGFIRTKYAPSYFKFRFDENGMTKDYSGLSALFDADDYEGAAADLVKEVEDANPYYTDELWYATNDATKKILRDSYNAGMMTEDNFNFVSGMYRNYIPLRGWGDTNADQVWNYVGGGKGAFNQVVKEAKGRKSLADDPIAYIENMAESAILMNNRNWVKQHLLLLAQNHRTSLLNVSKAWYIKTKDAQGNEEWIPASPQITEGMTGKQVEAALEAFEQKMEQMQQNGEATQKREHLEISYPQTNGEEREHEVRVMKGGEEYVIYVNGDPQLAQAVNNTRARKVREGLESSISAKVIARTGRYMAAAYTSMSPLFIPSNYMRDLTMTLASTAIREDARYNYLLRRNMLRHWNTFPMVLSYQNGTLREKVRNGSASRVEQMFYDFMMNGGETGFVTSVDVEDLKKKFRNDLKDLNRMAANPKKVGHIIMNSIETLNRAIEDSNRFMVYMTSIEYGRSIEEAVNNAKDVTLNFNRKGTGEHWMQNIRNLYLFINPAIQSLQTLGALAKHHPFKFTTVTTGWLASGLLAPMLNNLLMSFFGGDDDKDKYWQFTKWDRRNNFIMWIPFTKEFVKIPLAQEFRGFYGVGDMIASKLWGGEKAEESWRDYAVDLAGQIVDMLPLDPTGYDGNVLIALMPNVFRPIFELGDNVDFTGKPIFRNSEYNKYDPNFTKAYVGTPDWLVRISKMVNSIDNKYPDVQQNAIDRFGDPRFNLNNPAVVDHVLSSYLGGAYTMGSQILGVATKALNGDDIKMADIPLASKFVSNPDDRPVSKKQGEEFWDMKERHDRAANTLSKLKKKAKVDGDYSTLDIFFGSDEYRQYKEDDKKVKKYEEDRKKEKAQETGVEYRPHKTTADDVYKSHATPKDDFEDMKMKQLYEKLNSYKIRYEAIDGISSEKGDAYYKANKAAIDAIEEIAYDKSMISTIKKGFLSDGQDSYDADGMKDIREMRKRILDVLEKANKTMMNNRK